MFIRNALGLTAALLYSAHAAAGTYIEASWADLADPLRPPQTERMWFDAGNFRLESESGDAIEIFKDRTLYLVEPLRKRYAAFDAATLRLLGRPRVARETSRTESSGGRACTVWEITVEAVKVRELCVIPADSVPGGAQILADMRQIGEIIDEMSLGETPQDSVADSWSDLDRVNGIPVLSRSFEGGQVTVEIQVTAVRSDPVPFTAFEVPAGFKRHKLERRGHA